MGKRDPRVSRVGEEPTTWEISVYDLHCERYTYRQIAAEVGSNRQTVGRIVDKVSEWMKPQIFEKRSQIITDQLQQLEHIANEAMEIYRRSVGESVEVSETVGEDGQSITTKTKALSGDVSALRMALEAMRHIREVMGIVDARQGSGGGRVAGRDMNEVIDEKIAALEEFRQRQMKPSKN